jgi:signal transduction histidine kinase/Tfp pilus assembly protein PilF
MRKISYLFLLVLFLIPIGTNGQKENVSLWHKQLKAEKTDTGKISIYRKLGKYYQKEKHDSSIYFFNKGIAIALRKDLPLLRADLLAEKAKVFYYKGNYHQSIDSLEKSLKLFNTRNNIDGQASVTNNIGVIYYNLSDYPKALKYWNKALQYYEKNSDSLGMATCYSNVGVIHYKKARANDALSHFIKALKIRKKYDDKEGLASIYSKMGMIYKNYLQDNKKALNYLKKAMLLYEELNDEVGRTKILINMGNVYEELDSLDKSLKLHVEALNIAEKINNKRLIAICYTNMASYYQTNKNYERALKYYNNALKINKELGRKSETAESYSHLGYFHYNMGQYTRAINYYKKSIDIFEQLGIYEGLANAYEMIASSYAKNGNYKKGWEYKNKFGEVKDTLYQREKSEKLAKLRSDFEHEKNEKEIALLKKEKKLKAAKLKRSRIILYYSIALLLAIVVFSVFIYIRYKKNKNLTKELKTKNNAIEEQKEEITQQSEHLKEANNLLVKKNKENEKNQEKLKEINSMKDRIFSIIGHDLKGPIGSLRNTLELLLKKQYDKEKVKKFHKLMHDNVSSIYTLLDNLLMWAKNQQNEISYSPGNYSMNDIIENNLGLLRNAAKNKNIRVNKDMDKDYTGYFDNNMISTVIRNILSNAIKFTKHEGSIDIKISENGNYLNVVIADNGIGMERSTLNKIMEANEHISTRGTNQEKGSGLGLHICRKFVEKNQGSFSIDSKLEKGTKVIFSVPKDKN